MTAPSGMVVDVVEVDEGDVVDVVVEELVVVVSFGTDVDVVVVVGPLPGDGT